MNSSFIMKLKNQILLPVPVNIHSMWNFGSLLGLVLASQIFTGFFLAMHYSSEISSAFFSVDHIMRDVNGGWFLRMAHANGASAFFICMYLHIARGIYFGSYKLFLTWTIGVIIFLISMATAFLGYVLPWGQMSFWGATVITNLVSVIPFIGNDIITWVWGGFSVGGATLSRFFSLHFLMPFLILVLVISHFISLHSSGSSNPLGVESDKSKIYFHPYHVIKDATGILLFCMFMSIIVFIYPWLLGDVENFKEADPLVTPEHIQPEWYFLFAYAILRAIPNKLGGVLALLFSVLMLMALPFLAANEKISPRFNPILKINFWILVFIMLLLTWAGARPVEGMYILAGQILSVIYFMIFFLRFYLNLFFNNIMQYKM